MKFKVNTKKGITLIALVITIIVLLILAGVTIATLTGENGLLNKASNSGDETRMKTAEEKINLKITTLQMKKYSENQIMPTLQNLADELCEDNDIEYVLLKEQEQASLEKITVGETDSILTKLKEYPYEFEIDKDLKLASINGTAVASTNTSQQYNPDIYDQWPVWLHLGGIQNPEQYNGQNIVESEELMNTLLKSEDAIDYMLKSKYFIMQAIGNSETCINHIFTNEDFRKIIFDKPTFIRRIVESNIGSRLDQYATKVPRQTEVTSSIVYSGQLLTATSPKNAFNYSNASGWDDNQMWQDKTSTDDGYLGYNFGEETILYKVAINCATYNNASNSYSFVVEGLKSDGNWEQIGDEHMAEFTSANTFVTKTYDIISEKKYYGYRIKNNYSVSGHGQRYWAVYAGSGFGIGELQFYCVK